MASVQRLALPPFYRAAEVLAYHGRDPLSLSEGVAGSTIRKALRLGGEPLRLEISLEDGVAVLRADRELDRGEAATVRRVAERMLGLGGDPARFEASLAAGDPIAAIVAARPGLRIPLTADPWEALCWAVIGQQINLTFAASLRRELVQIAGTPYGEGMRAHPGPAEVAALEPEALTARRYSRSKASYLVGTARRIADGSFNLDAVGTLPMPEAEAALKALHGIGPWTARYILLRGFGFADVAPIGDSGLATGLQRAFGLDERPDIRAQEAAMQAYSPHRSLVTAHLWAALTSPRPSPSPAATG